VRLPDWRFTPVPRKLLFRRALLRSSARRAASTAHQFVNRAGAFVMPAPAQRQARRRRTMRATADTNESRADFKAINTGEWRRTIFLRRVVFAASGNMFGSHRRTQRAWPFHLQTVCHRDDPVLKPRKAPWPASSAASAAASATRSPCSSAHTAAAVVERVGFRESASAHDEIEFDRVRPRRASTWFQYGLRT
jgi:hypothetical protein